MNWLGKEERRRWRENLRLRKSWTESQHLFGLLVQLQLGCHGNEGLEVKCLGNSITE